MYWVDFIALAEHQLSFASHRQIIDLRKRCRVTERERFHAGQPAKVEVCKAFQETGYKRFMDLVENESEEDHALYTVMTCLGLRHNESIRLTGRDVSEDTIRIPGSKHGFAGFFHIPPALLKFIPPADRDEPLFYRLNDYGRPRTRGGALRALSRSFENYRRAAGMDEIYLYAKASRADLPDVPRYVYSLHSFRYTGMVRFFRLSGSVEYTRRWARHKSIATTLHYLRVYLASGEIESVMAKMPDADRYLPPVSSPVAAVAPHYLMP
jgi:hypothetical protein